MIVRRAYIPTDLLEDELAWPFTLPPITQLAQEGILFHHPVTFIVGENGSGKSTLVEAIAEAYGLDAQGGRAGRKYGNARPKTALGETLRLETTVMGARMQAGPRGKKRGFFLRAETAFGLMETVSGMNGYWRENTSEMSHGEGFLTVLGAMFKDPGLYVLDEPEAALSFNSCLRLVHLIHELGECGAQVICATHSPIISSTPGADIIELGDHGYRRCEWKDLETVDHWRRYLNNPDIYLRTLLQ
jgi:predicted ATPase